MGEQQSEDNNMAELENKDKREKESNINKSNYLKNIVRNVNEVAPIRKENEQINNAMLLPDSKTVPMFSPIWKQTLAASASILVTMTAGLTSGYSAVLLPQLKESEDGILVDDETASWIASMAALPMAPGCLISGWMMEKFGRRSSHFIICAPFLLGWILLACATNLNLILIGRFLTGLCLGVLGPLGPVYIGETSEPKYRGFFLAGVSLAIALGILIAHLIGTFVIWYWTAAICCLFPCISIILLCFVPESPTWLISRGRVEDGVKAFTWLRGFSEEAKLELKGLIEKHMTMSSEVNMNWRDKILSLTTPELFKPLLIMILFFITSQFSGINAIAFYSVDIVGKAVGKGINRYLIMLIIDAVRVIMSVAACIVCKRYGRRPMCFVSGIWTALSMTGLSMYLYFTGAQSSNLSWIPLTCLMVYICAISIGFVPLPWMMCGEIFPSTVRGLGSGISSATAFAAFFVVVKTSPGMMKHLGEVSTFLTYGLIALMGTFVLYFILPETKGKSLQEIEEKFKKYSSTKL